MTNKWESSKLNFFRPDAFGFINQLKTEPSKYDMINLSIGAPNKPTPKWVVDSMKENLDVEKYHTYPPQFGAPELCEAVARWYDKRFNVKLDPKDNVLITIGIKEAIFNAFHAVINAGDTVLVPDPGYPTYFEAVLFTGGKMVPYYSDDDENNVLDEIEGKAKLLNPKIVIVNYPANPTGRMATPGFYKRLSEMSAKYGFMVMSDLAYSEIAYDGIKVGSYLSAQNNLDRGMEYFAFSKTYNMAGWRVGAIVGEKAIIDAIKLYKSKIDSNVFYPIQMAAVTALDKTPDSFYKDLSDMYQGRRDVFVKGLKAAGIEFTKPEGAMYVWAKVPAGLDPWTFTDNLYREYGLLVVPGTAYGNYGSDRVRIGLVQDYPVMEEAAARLINGGGF